MITINKNNFLRVVEHRGYSLQEVSGCIVSQDDENVVIDHSHPSYPRPKNMTHEQFLESIRDRLNNPQPILQQTTEQEIEEGTGTELKKLLKMMGITPAPNCSCNAKAKFMNQKGIQWSKDNINIIVGWLKEEATKRNLPFFTYGAKKLVELAIYRAEKNTKNS